MKGYLKDKGIGFWFSIVITILSLITAIVYIVSYNNTDNFNMAAFVLMLAAALVGIVLLVCKQLKLIPYLQAILIYLSLLFFIYGIYYYVSVLAVGIDIQEVDPEFIVCTALFFLTFVLSVANVFLKQTKEVTANA